jgi:hypothetical protein
VNIPEPNEFAASKGFKPFPPRWERWLSSVQNAILAGQTLAGRFTTVDVHPGKGTIVNAERERGGGGGGGANCPTGDTVTVAFSGIVSCGCLTDGFSSYLGTDIGGINTAFTLTRFSPTEFIVTVPNLFSVKSWFSLSDCSGPPDTDETHNCTVYARCIEHDPVGSWTVSIQDTVSLFWFAFFASDFNTTLTNESTCSPFTFTDLFHNGTAIVTF